MASVQLNSEPAVTAISVSARIDYIQRFSKQAVLVIDHDVAVYTQAAREFLMNLSQEKPIKEKPIQETNVAFVSASTKLNDIQMRCRLIEQLFANTLFDPEKSLAVSILNLSKQSKDNINIIIEHAHALSLQIKYELCQLVDVANKTHNKINVVLFGLEQAAQDAVINKSIFKNKLSIIDAKSGQLFSLDHAKFTCDNSLFTNKFWLKLLATVVLISGLIGITWFVMINYDNFSLSQLPLDNTNTTADKNLLESELKLIAKKDSEMINEKMTKAKDIIEVNTANELAKASDIQAALLGEMMSSARVDNIPAQTTDILQALNLNETKNTPKLAITPEVPLEKAEIKISTAPILVTNEAIIQSTDVVLPLALTPNYYLNTPKGYVVQIVGFTDLTLLKRFMKTYPNLQYFSYQKKLDDQMFIVLTTKIFENQKQAREALQTLPQALVDRGVWVKALSIVQAEINTL